MFWNIVICILVLYNKVYFDFFFGQLFGSKSAPLIFTYLSIFQQEMLCTRYFRGSLNTNIVKLLRTY